MSLRIESVVESERVDTFQGFWVGCLGLHPTPVNIQRNLQLLISAAEGLAEHKTLLQLTKKAPFSLGSYVLNPADVHVRFIMQRRYLGYR